MKKEKINRKKVVGRHNPILTKIDYESPLTVGNGFFAYTFDITGMQSLNSYYQKNNNPLCTMAEWGWHTTPYSKEQYECDRAELEMTEYQSDGKKFSYAVKAKPGNESVYHWFRHNPHRFNLAEIGLLYQEKELSPEMIAGIKQELDLFEGSAVSRFSIEGQACEIHTAADGRDDKIGFLIQSKELGKENLKVRIRFGSPSYETSGVDWNKAEDNNVHKTEILKCSKKQLLLKRIIDKEVYMVQIQVKEGVITKNNQNEFFCNAVGDAMELTVGFYNKEQLTSDMEFPYGFHTIYESSRSHWDEFWMNGGFADFSDSKDARAKELERRIILSLYLTALQCCGNIPPQETGLTCNSWYGKFHLEMHLWHAAHLPLWNRGYLLERSMPWYVSILKKAKQNAEINGFSGARWPKMVGPEGIDSPSEIATLLIWQQPHILYMLELLYQEKLRKDESKAMKFLKKYWEIVRETADFMADFAVGNPNTGEYELLAPMIPAQENHNPMDVKNPTYELEYWKFGLHIAYDWAVRLHTEKDNSQKWIHISDKMAVPSYDNGVYIAHENCPDTFEKFNTDHPSMVAAYGLLPGYNINPDYMENTLDKICSCWNFDSMWGWDFAMMAMTANRLGSPDKVIDFLLMDKKKNSYVISGNNYQKSNDKLPLYLPGNGSLLLAVAMMLAGYGKKADTILGGLPKDGNWNVRFEDISGFPY